MKVCRAIGIDAPQGAAVLDVDSRGAATFVAREELPKGKESRRFWTLIDIYEPMVVGVELVAYERDNKLRGGVYARLGFGPRMAGNLYLSGLVAGRLIECCDVRNVPVLLCCEKEARGALGARDDATVKQVLRLRVKGWPKDAARPGQRSSTVHERDGGLTALWAGLTWLDQQRRATG